MTDQDPPATALEVCRYDMARHFLAEGRRDGALVIAGELLNSSTGRRLALALLVELYPRHRVETVAAEAAVGRGGEQALGGEETIETSAGNARADTAPPEPTEG